jgi:ribosome-associated protein YbcJ (S4-like RNA binding protein)
LLLKITKKVYKGREVDFEDLLLKITKKVYKGREVDFEDLFH